VTGANAWCGVGTEQTVRTISVSRSAAIFGMVTSLGGYRL